MKKRLGRTWQPPGPQTLSMDWFLDEPGHGKIPLGILLQIKAILESMEKGFLPDPHRCHSNMEEHDQAVAFCASLLHDFGIAHPYRFLELWSTSEIYGELETFACILANGDEIQNPDAYLWTMLNRKRESREET